MSKKMPRVNRNQKGSFPALPVLILVIVLGFLSFGIAAAWQKLSGDDEKLPKQSSSQSASVSESSQPENSLPESSISEEQSSPQQSSSSQAITEVEFGVPIPESARVRSEYFDDAMFVGDSITTGIKVYDVMSNATVIASTGINPDTILHSKVIKDANGNAKTVIDAMKDYQPKKIYIMLGANGVAFLDKETMIDLYGQFVDLVKAQHPDSIIYVQSILPVTKEKADGDSRYSNAKIDEYNQAIIEMTKQKQVYYLNVAEAFKDENGALPSEGSPDGMHFNPPYYTKWFDYLKTHTLPNS